MPPDRYIMDRHIDGMDYYFGLSNNARLKPEERQQWYRFAVESCAVVENMGPTIDGLILLNASIQQLAGIINADLASPISMSSLTKDLSAILTGLKIPRIRGYSPRGSRNILAK